MSKDKLGTKQVCPSCEARFYDLNKRPCVCPKCGKEFDPEDEVIRTTITKVKAKAAKAAVKTEDDDEDDDDEDDSAARTNDDDEDEDESIFGSYRKTKSGKDILDEYKKSFNFGSFF